jgi:hypothetical protein
MSNPSTIELLADSVKINGPRIDGSYSITFSCGEYMKKEIAKILNLPESVLQVSVTEYTQ